jgi:hypothetical protein
LKTRLQSCLQLLQVLVLILKLSCKTLQTSHHPLLRLLELLLLLTSWLQLCS